MRRYCIIICLLLIGILLFSFGHGAEENGEAFEFEVEIFGAMSTALHVARVKKEGPTLTSDPRIREKLCVAAMKHVSFEKSNPNASIIGTSSSPWGHPRYPDKEDDAGKFINYLYCATTPRQIYIRAAAQDNTFIIMIPGFENSADGFYGMSRREYIFGAIFIQPEPVESANVDYSEEDTLSTIKEDDLREVYQRMRFLDWMLVCLRAKDFILKITAMAKPVMQHSPVGYRPLKIYLSDGTPVFEGLGFRCPITPYFYVYLENSISVGIAIVTGPQPGCASSSGTISDASEEVMKVQR